MDRVAGHLIRPVTNVASSISWCKIIALGNACVGKTCIIKHFCDAEFSGSYQPTVGVDYGFKICRVTDKEFYINIWDFSGRHEYCDVRNELYEDTEGIFLVYDVTSKATFEDLDSWLREYHKFGKKNIKLVVAANKVDYNERRVVQKEEGMEWATAHDAKYFETSAVTGEGIKELFSTLISLINSNPDTSSK